MTGPDIIILWKEQDLIDQLEFLLEQLRFGDYDSCIPESEQDKSFFAILIYVLYINII